VQWLVALDTNANENACQNSIPRWRPKSSATDERSRRDGQATSPSA
jgi:hypothetical protein